MTDPIRTRLFHINRHAFGKAMMRKIPYLRVAIVAAAMGAGAWVLILFLGTGVVSLIAVAAVFVGSFLNGQRVSIERGVRDPKNESVFADRVVEIDDWGLHTQSTTGMKSDMPWSVVTKVDRAGDFWLVYFSAAYFVAIPDDAFPEPADLERFRQAVREKVGPAKAVRL